MPYGTASNKLRLKVIFDLLREFEKNTCCQCGQLIDAPENLSVAHRQQWMDVNPTLFWRTDNIVFKHRVCPDVARQDNMSIIEVNVLNKWGEKLNTYSHDGKIWIAGRNGERYDIQIKNNSSDRIEVVTSVDGRDVISGEVANYEDTEQVGYVINPWDNYTIKGFRQSDDKVAAFRFTEPGESYSTKMGTPQNVGVIGVAVFREKRPQYQWNDSLARGGKYDLVGCGYSKPKGYNPFNVDVDYFIPSGRADDGSSLTIPSFESDFSVPPAGGGGGTYSSAGPAGGQSGGTQQYSATSINVVHTTGERGISHDSSRRTRKMRRRKSATRSMAPELGTEYGESLHSSVTTIQFTRESPTQPNEIHTVRYDSHRGLERRGIDLARPNEQVEPEAFPGAYVAPGYAPPPPR